MKCDDRDSQRRESLKKEKVNDSNGKSFKMIPSILQISYIIAKWICLWSKQVYLKELDKRLVCRYFKVYNMKMLIF